MGLELRLAIRGDFDKLEGCGRLYVNNRRLLCTFCNCDTTFAFSPTAILDHFDMNHRKCLEVLLLQQGENRIFDAELADLRLHNSQHDAMGIQLHTSIVALRDHENIVLKEDAGALEETNHELYGHCLQLNQAIYAKFDEVKRLTPNSMEEIARKLADLLSK